MGLYKVLNDGVYLCNLMNNLQPGSVKQVHIVEYYGESQKKFGAMQNIGNFLMGCDAYGVPKSDQFQAEQLYYALNMPQVLVCLESLAEKASINGKPGLGGKAESEKNCGTGTNQEAFPTRQNLGKNNCN